MPNNNDQCGLFGKLPQQADFVSQFLPEEFTELWHNWLQASMSVSREQLEHDWLNCYLTSPVWNFAASSQVLSHEPVMGVMIPSVDEIGRYFPLSLAKIGSDSPWAAYLHGKEWFSALQEVALLALDENTNYEKFIVAFEALEPPSLPPMPAFSPPEPGHKAPDYVFDNSDGQPPEAFALTLLSHAYQCLSGQFVLWWTEGSEHVAPCLLITRGLPESGQFAAMLDGQWQKWGWTQETVIDTSGA